MQYGFRQRKAERTQRYYRYIYGYRQQPCVACAGSGYYDSHGSPPCARWMHGGAKGFDTQAHDVGVEQGESEASE